MHSSMADYFATTEMSSALSSLAAKLTGKVGEVGLYPMLKKATSSSDQPTPGYVYQVLVEFSFESAENSQHLARYLNTRLQRPSVNGVLKTIKTIKQLTEKGSREFRRFLRGNDEYIKNAGDYAGQEGAFGKEAALAEVRTLSQEVLLLLFNQSIVERDANKEVEVAPSQAMGLAGMGRSMGGQGRLEGFGSEPVNRSSVIDRARDMLESVVSLPDPKQQIMELCLQDDLGNYEAVHLPGLPPVQGRLGRSCVEDVPKAHTPGRAGGGWEDSSDEEQKVIEDISRSLVSEEGNKLEDSDIVASKEYQTVRDFCLEENSDNIVDKCEDASASVASGDVKNALLCLVEILESDNVSAQFRGLLLLESLIYRETLTPSLFSSDTFCSKHLNILQKSTSPKVAVKAKKISLILNMLTDTKSS